MFERELENLEQEYKKVLDDLANPSIEPSLRAKLSKKSSRLEQIIAIKKEMASIIEQKADAKTMSQGDDPELAELGSLEIKELDKKYEELNSRLEDILFPPDPRDEKAAYLEIRAGAGGQEASLFAADLIRAYSNYAISKNWQFSINSSSTTEVGGYREVIAHIQGKNVYKYLKYESGVHRVQRVPKTEAAGRIHTSTITVAVMPEADDVEVDINPADLRVDVFRSSGAGGQHVNTTDSAVRITHIPTGVVVSCQEERSQQKNKAKALKELKSRLLKAELEKAEKERSEKRKQQIGSGERSEKIRTYNYPQNRITDHRIGLTLKKLDMVMHSGNLDEIIEPLIDTERKERISQPPEIIEE